MDLNSYDDHLVVLLHVEGLLHAFVTVDIGRLRQSTSNIPSSEANDEASSSTYFAAMPSTYSGSVYHRPESVVSLSIYSTALQLKSRITANSSLATT